MRGGNHALTSRALSGHEPAPGYFPCFVVFAEIPRRHRGWLAVGTARGAEDDRQHDRRFAHLRRGDDCDISSGATPNVTNVRQYRSEVRSYRFQRVNRLHDQAKC